ncbi:MULTISPECIES: RHS repeat-associated core domain-containing protein [Pseudomonas]|uniref:RHS repeat-associated core domain-containing protein n=1 Tax=Pseudomonas TaxID=286 RepID=UPI000AF5D4D6|nr:RHS repeat-associated core domain-containing protein [Pseudomonas fluorescens]
MEGATSQGNARGHGDASVLAVLLVAAHPNPLNTCAWLSGAHPMQTPWKTVLCRYHYDALDHLNAQTLPGKPRLQRFHCENRLATEIQGVVRRSIIQQGGWLFAQQQHHDTLFDATLLATDGQQSVLFTIAESNRRQSIAYSPYGHPSTENGPSRVPGFNGEQPDPVTGHYPLGNGYRTFNPVLMRFNSPDRFSPFGKGGLNAYVYCSGDPINKKDPEGTSPFTWLARQVGLKKIHLGGGVWTRKGIPAGVGKHFYSRAKEIDNKLEFLEESLRRKMFNADYQELSASKEPPVVTSLRLEKLAYDVLPKRSYPFGIEQGLESPFDEVVRNVAAADRQTYLDRERYRGVLKYVADRPNKRILDTLTLAGLDKSLDPEMVNLYYLRMARVKTEQTDKLTREYNTIFTRYIRK